MMIIIQPRQVRAFPGVPEVMPTLYQGIKVTVRQLSGYGGGLRFYRGSL